MKVFKSIFTVISIVVTLTSVVSAVTPVRLGNAANFVVLTKAGISSVPPSLIKGNIGVSPIASTAMTGFGLSADPSNTFSTSVQIKGRAYAANYAIPTPSEMTTTISDMEAAYTEAAGRPISSAANLNIQSGLISGMTFKPGVYTWGTDVMFGSDIYIKGSSEDVFIFQSSGNFVAGSGAKIILVDEGSGGGGPRQENIVWQIAGFLDAGTTAHLEGVFMVKTHAVFKTGSSLNGRIFSQTACTLDSATIVDPRILERPSTRDDENTEGGSTEDDSANTDEDIEDDSTGDDPYHDSDTDEPIPVDGRPEKPAAVKTKNK
jgi:hypothetical protein